MHPCVSVCPPFFGHRHGHLRGVMHTVQHANRMSLNIKWDRVTIAHEPIMQMREQPSLRKTHQVDYVLMERSTGFTMKFMSVRFDEILCDR